MSLLRVNGAQHQLPCARRIGVFGSLDRHSDAGWAQLEQSIRALARDALAPLPG